MTAYFNDLKLLFQKAGAFPAQKVVLHMEPDLWGFMEQRAANDDARTVPAKIAETGIPELASLPSNMSGFAQAVIKLRDAYAPNGFSVSTGKRIVMWQIPLGNTQMRAQNNTTGHYQDNRPGVAAERTGPIPPGRLP